MTSHPFPTRCAAGAFAASVCMLIGTGVAAQTPPDDGRSQRLEHHRAACLLNRPTANVDSCVEEALAARQAASRGELQDGGAAYQRNALLRCRALPASDQPACEARIHGSGTASGSVEEGGILRELVVRERPSAKAAVSEETTTPVRVDPNGDGLSDAVPAEPTAPNGPRLPR